MVFSGAALPAPYSILEVGPLGPAGGAAEGPELGYGAPNWGMLVLSVVSLLTTHQSPVHHAYHTHTLERLRMVHLDVDH